MANLIGLMTNMILDPVLILGPDHFRTGCNRGGDRYGDGPGDRDE